jgi:hypothetical protein
MFVQNSSQSLKSTFQGNKHPAVIHLGIIGNPDRTCAFWRKQWFELPRFGTALPFHRQTYTLSENEQSSQPFIIIAVKTYQQRAALIELHFCPAVFRKLFDEPRI